MCQVLSCAFARSPGPRSFACAYANRGECFPESPTWKILAEALVMASGYE
jgi:hypothetical protein